MNEASGGSGGDSGAGQAGPGTGDGPTSQRVPWQRDPFARPETAAVPEQAPPPDTPAPDLPADRVPFPAPVPGDEQLPSDGPAANVEAPAGVVPSQRRSGEHPDADAEDGPPAPSPPSEPSEPSEAPQPSTPSVEAAPSGVSDLSDAQLIAEVRAGRDSAYEEVYRRHAASVRRYARSCCRDAHTAEDLTGEVFARTLKAIRGGSGPETAVRAYLLTTVRRVAAAWGNTARREQLVEDFAVFAVGAAGATADSERSDLGADVRAMHQAERSLAIRAFRTLPERWQTVLWHTAVEDESPSEVAPLLGLTPNATAVLAHRAREGLRQAYLQAHVSSTLTGEGECARYADRLGAHARGGLRTRADRELNRHLKQCPRCTAASLELADLNSSLKGLLPVAFIGWFAASSAAKAAGLVAVGGAAAAAGGATAAAGSGSTAAGGTAVAGGAGAAGSGGGGASGLAAAGEGLGAPAKAGIAAAAVVAAAATAFALSGGHHAKPPAKPLAKAPVSASAAPTFKPTPHRSTRTPIPPATTPPAAPPVVTPTPSTSPPLSPSPTPTPTPTATPTVTPTPPPTTPVPSPPVPTYYTLDTLPIGFPGRAASTPTMRVPALPLTWWWDRSRLSIDGVRYRHGITVHAPSDLTVDLHRACLSYDARVGIDDLVRPLRAPSARFSVYGDTTLLWTSPLLTARSPAVPVHVSLRDFRTLRLVVTSQRGPVLGLSELADWAQAEIGCETAG